MKLRVYSMIFAFFAFSISCPGETESEGVTFDHVENHELNGKKQPNLVFVRNTNSYNVYVEFTYFFTYRKKVDGEWVVHRTDKKRFGKKSVLANKDRPFVPEALPPAGAEVGDLHVSNIQVTKIDR